MTRTDDLSFSAELEQAEIEARTSIYLPLQPQRLVDSRGQPATVLLPDNNVRPYIGRALGLGSGRPVEEGTIVQIIDYYESAGADTILMAVPPTARPPSLPRLLEACRFQPALREARLYLAADNPPPLDPFARIRQATPEDVPAMEALLVASGIPAKLATFLMSPVGRTNWRHFVAIDDGSIVALAGMFVHSRTAWLIPGLTSSSHRRQGYQRALISHRVAEAQRLGCSWVTTNVAINESEPPGLSFRSHTRLGFQLLYLRTTYLWQAPGTPVPDIRGR